MWYIKAGGGGGGAAAPRPHAAAPHTDRRLHQGTGDTQDNYPMSSLFWSHFQTFESESSMKRFSLHSRQNNASVICDVEPFQKVKCQKSKWEHEIVHAIGVKQMEIHCTVCRFSRRTFSL